MSRRLLLALGVVFAALPGASAAEGDDFLGHPGRRTLNGHRFVPDVSLPDPFITTHVGNSIGIGRAVGLSNPLLEIDGQPVLLLEGKLTLISVRFEYAHAVREWLSVGAGFRAIGRLGTNANTLLAQGVQAAVGFDLGWKLRIRRTDTWQLSGALVASNTGLTSVNVLDWIADGIDGGDTSLVRNIPSLRGGGGLRWAYGLNRTVGLLAAATAGFGEALDDRGDTGWFFEGGGGVSVDLRPRWRKPIGLLLAGDVTSFPETGQDLSEDTASGRARLAYTGRDDFLVALDLSVRWTRHSRYDQAISVRSAAVGLHYWF